MYKIIKVFSIAIVILILLLPLYVYSSEVAIVPINVSNAPLMKIAPLKYDKAFPNSPYIHLKFKEKYMTFSDWVNAKSHYDFHIDKNAERRSLREQWQQMLGADIFFLYFKADEIKDKVEEKVSIRIFKLKGKLELKKDQTRFIFNVKF